MIKSAADHNRLLSRLLIGLLVASTWVSPALALAQESSLRDVINRQIQAGWEKERLTPPARSSDAVFLRRVYLDLVGMIPTFDETTTFLDTV